MSFLNRWLIAIALIGAVVISLYYPLTRVSQQFLMSANEGWNAYHAQEVLHNQPLYTKNNSLTPLNYPPLSYYLIGGLANLGFDPLILGRIISLLSMLAVIGMVGWLTFTNTDSPSIAVISASFCLLMFCQVALDYIAINDPQFLAEMVMVLGLVFYFRYLESKLDSKNIIIMTNLMLVSLFTKHNLLALPLAIASHLFLYHRRDFWLFLKLLIAEGLMLVGLFELLSNGLFLMSILSSREYSLGRLIDYSIIVFVFIEFPVIFGGIFNVLTFRNSKSNIINYYFTYALIIGLILVGGDGASTNMFFDLIISLSLLIGIGLNRFKSISFLAASLISFWLIYFSIDMFLAQKSAFIENKRLASQEVNLLKNFAGSTICTNYTLCYYSGKPFLFDRFLVEQKIMSGQLSQQTVLSEIESYNVEIIQWSGVLDDPRRQAIDIALKNKLVRGYHLIDHSIDEIYIKN